MKLLASIFTFGATALILTGCCCDTYDACEPCYKPAPRCEKPCERPCEKPCDPCHKPVNHCPAPCRY